MKRFEDNGLPNGREAWIELERIYGGNEMEQRPAQLLDLGGKLRETRCNDVNNIPDFLLRLHGI